MTLPNLWNPSLETILGLFDADGSFQVKIYHGKKSISFHVNAIFTQKLENKDVLQGVLNTLGAAHLAISTRQIQNSSGTKSASASICLALSNSAGKRLLETWKLKPPAAPTKRLDYSIAVILFEASKKNSQTVVNHFIENSKVQDKSIAELTLLWLRYQMYFAKKQKKQSKSLEAHYLKTSATPEKIRKSIYFGKKMFAKIKQQILTNFENSLPKLLSEDRLIGYMVGDGSFQIQTTFGANTAFKGSFSWTLTDCKENLPLLKAIRDKLLREKVVDFVGMANYSSYYRLRVGGVQNCKRLVSRWQNLDLPQARQDQFDIFCQALAVYTSKNFRSEVDEMKKFISLKWRMNPHTNIKKKGSLEKDLDKIEVFYQKF